MPIPVANQQKPCRPSRSESLDGFRGIAILMVLGHHLTVFDMGSGLPSRWAILAEFCSHGVDLFFVLSGFLIVDHLKLEVSREGWMRRFWIKRTAKIVPSYFAALAFVFILLPLLLRITNSGSKLALQQKVHGNWPWYAGFASNFLNALDGRFTNPALDVCWSLGIEIQFYLLIAFGVRLFGLPGRLVLSVAVGIAVATRTLAALSGATWITVMVLPWNRLDAFAMGAAAALGVWPWLQGRVGLCIVLIAAAAPFLLPWSREALWVQIAGYTLVATAAAAAIVKFGKTNQGGVIQQMLCLRPLRFCGAISYSVYLTHLPIRAALRDLILPHWIKPLVGNSIVIQQTVFVIVAGALCLTAGWLFWRLFEEPMRLFIMKQARPASGGCLGSTAA